MRYLVLGAILLFSTAGAASADGGLTDAVANAFLIRTVDAGLHDIAHARVAEVAAAGELSHEGMRSGTAEVLAWNQGVPSPMAEAVRQWIGSSVHRGILSDGSYGRIGCAELVADGVHWFACVLASGPLPAQRSAGLTLPDTGLAPPAARSLGGRWRLLID
jgi:hypothetical protein